MKKALCVWSVDRVTFLQQEAHTKTLTELRFTLAFVRCVMEMASSKDPGLEASSSPDLSFLQQSLVADQISLLSREWRSVSGMWLWSVYSLVSHKTQNIHMTHIYLFPYVCAVLLPIAVLSSWCCTWSVRSFSPPLCTRLKRTSKKVGCSPRPQWSNVRATRSRLPHFQFNECKKNTRRLWWSDDDDVSLVCSGPAAERVVQGVRGVLPLAQQPAAELPAWQAEADGTLQWHRSRETYLPARCAHGRLPVTQLLEHWREYCHC